MKLKLVAFMLVVCMTLGMCVFAESDGRDKVKVPALMYHCVNDESSDFTVTSELFRAHMTVLLENGYTPVSLEELVDYVDNGEKLPEKPVCITFDDGYTDNYTCAYPILKEFNFKATIFVIGSSVGKNTYKNTGFEMIPHFGFDEAKEMTESGLISVQSHTYDMHQAKRFETVSHPRENLSRFQGEGLMEYLTALENDVIVEKTLIETNVGKRVIGMAYPMGCYNNFVELVLKKNGIRVSFATSEGMNYVRYNDKNSLYSLNRYNVDGTVSAERVLEWVSGE